MALRWSKTIGAYNKYKHLFAEPFPKEYPCKSPVSQAAYIRDALAFANENSLPGGQYYKQVKVSPFEGCVVVRPVNDNTLAKTYPVETIFSLLAQYKELPINYEFASTDNETMINEALANVGIKVSFRTTHYVVTVNENL